MKNYKILPPFISLMLILTSTAIAQMGFGTIGYKEGAVIGFGIGFSKFTTKWNHNLEFGQTLDPEIKNPPVHHHKKIEGILFVENRSIIKFGNFHTDARGELRISIPNVPAAGLKNISVTEHDYLLPPDVPNPSAVPKGISDGGLAFVIGGYFKEVYPMRVSPRLFFAPFFGIGLGFAHLRANGEGLAPIYENHPYEDLSYSSGWTEFSAYLPISIGCAFDYKRTVIMPEFRTAAVSYTTSNLRTTPPRKAKGPINSLRSFEFMLTVGFKR